MYLKIVEWDKDYKSYLLIDLFQIQIQPHGGGGGRLKGKINNYT